jgi:hypothetical protein
MTTLAPSADTVPIQGYDRLDFRPLVSELRQRSQEELTQIDVYEREHQERSPVLEKLRYLRGPEPLEHYDALDVDEILAAAADADRRRLGNVRSYETRMRERPEVLDGVHGLMRKDRPARKGQETEETADETRSRYAGNKAKDGAMIVFVFGLIGLAGVLMVIAVFLFVCVLISTVAPTAL